MDAAMRIFRALCLVGIAAGLAVALVAGIRRDADADPLPVTVTTATSTTSPARLGQAAVGLSGPIGATMDATATGTVRGWPHLPSLPSLGLPSAATISRLAIATVAVACLIVVAAVRL